MYKNYFKAAIIYGLIFTGCINASQKSRKAAEIWLESTNECIFDVRDRGIKYEKSRFCIDVVNKKDLYYDSDPSDLYAGNPDCEIEVIVQKSLKFMWMARAVSEGGGGFGNVSIAIRPSYRR